MKNPSDQRQASDEVGAVHRQLRRRRGITLATAARLSACTESLLSQVERGHRKMQPWLAAALDQIYNTGGAITALAGTPASDAPRSHNGLHEAADMIVVSVPGRAG